MISYGYSISEVRHLIIYICTLYIQNNTRGVGKKRSACSGTASHTTAPSKKKKANSTSAASRVSLFHDYILALYITIYMAVCVQILKTSRDLQNNENDPEDETEVREEDVMDDRSEYERSNDAKRHANKAFLHEHVLVRVKDTHRILLLLPFAQCHVVHTHVHNIRAYALLQTSLLNRITVGSMCMH